MFAQTLSDVSDGALSRTKVPEIVIAKPAHQA
jgi:hypothetical protein